MRPLQHDLRRPIRVLYRTEKRERSQELIEFLQENSLSTLKCVFSNLGLMKKKEASRVRGFRLRESGLWIYFLLICFLELLNKRAGIIAIILATPLNNSP